MCYHEKSTYETAAETAEFPKILQPVELRSAGNRLIGMIPANVLSVDAVATAARDLRAWHPEAGPNSVIRLGKLNRERARYGLDEITETTGVPRGGAADHPSVEFDQLTPSQTWETLIRYQYVA